jgi:hypothetical protein
MLSCLISCRNFLSLAVLFVVFQSACCLQVKGASSSGVRAREPEQCGPELPREVITELAEEAIRALGDDPAILRTNYLVSIESKDCEYVFTATPQGLGAVEGIAIRIDRSGKVKTFPWCCPLDDCPELCSSDTTQERY